MPTSLDHFDWPDIEQYITVNKTIKASSLNIIFRKLILFDRWLSEQGRTVSQDVFEVYIYSLSQRGLKNNTINPYLFMLRYLIEYLNDRTDAGLKIKFKARPKEKPDIDPLSVAEIEAILSVHIQYAQWCGKDCTFLDTVHRTLINFLACTGCRFDEAASLPIKFVDLSTERVRFMKTKTVWRAGYLNPALVEQMRVLMAGKGPDDLVFTNMANGKIHPQDFGRDLQRRKALSGVTKKVHPHIFRHSYATELLRNGVPIDEVAKLLGHADIQTTYNNYAHLADEFLKQATLRHPLVRMSAPAEDQLRLGREIFEHQRFSSDKRLLQRIAFGNGSLDIHLEIVASKPRQQFTQ